MSLSQVLNLYKRFGETPLECLERYRSFHPELSHISMTYAGRLDPLAEGVLIVLTGEEIKNKARYLSLDKEYEVEILLGFSTDTGDLLGIIEDVRNDYVKMNLAEDFFVKFIGKQIQKYPMFSSKTIFGKTLFSLAKRGSLKEDDLPVKEVEIKELVFIDNVIISKDNLDKRIQEALHLVHGDFRQDEIGKKWDSKIKGVNVDKFNLIKIRVSCTSGTYMRSLAKNIGIKLGDIPSLAYSIKRIKVGDYTIAKSLK